jgi:anti-anti-sigma regulatory factor
MGLYKIRRSDSKLTLQLKGDFDTENIDWITQLLKKRRFFICKIFELDMSEVGTISPEALSQLFIVLQILQGRETKTFITGLDPAIHLVPHQVEIRSTSQINTNETALAKEA